MERPITKAVVREFVGSAFVWLIPALLVLPLYLVIIGISVIASEGALLELMLRIRGGIHSALGVLLLLAAIALAIYLVQHGQLTAEDWVNGGFIVLCTAGGGAFLAHRELRKIASGDRPEH